MFLLGNVRHSHCIVPVSIQVTIGYFDKKLIETSLYNCIMMFCHYYGITEKCNRCPYMSFIFQCFRVILR
jgi:hypothetical protein